MKWKWRACYFKKKKSVFFFFLGGGGGGYETYDVKRVPCEDKLGSTDLLTREHLRYNICLSMQYSRPKIKYETAF